MIASCCPHCGSLITPGPRPSHCTSCGAALALQNPRPKSSLKLPLLVGALCCIAFAFLLVTSHFRKGASEEASWVEKKTAALAAARGGSAGMFRRAWEEAATVAAAKPDRMGSLRADLERQLAADFPAALVKVRERANAKMAAEALTDWKCLQAANLETPESEARRARDVEIRAAGIDVAHAASLADLGAGRYELAFEHHRTACGLCPGEADPGTRRRIHQELETPLAEWLRANRDAIADAVASKDDLRIAEAAGPGARILAGLRVHESGSGGKGAPSWSSGFVRAYEDVLASVPVKKLVVTVVGDDAAAAIVRQICTVGFPYELVFRTVADAGAAEAAASDGAEPAWMTVEIRVEWEFVDYKKTSGLTFSGDYRLPVGLAVVPRIPARPGESCPWPTERWERALSSPQKLEVRGRDDRERKEDFDRQQAQRRQSLETDLRTYLSGWKPWILPVPKSR
ncbi:MAG: hypothetical protein HYY18_18180 [Planctomycetes bacterium]|nr:hypothetical protein [Planctomycetota bacterium]